MKIIILLDPDIQSFKYCLSSDQLVKVYRKVSSKEPMIHPLSEIHRNSQKVTAYLSECSERDEPLECRSPNLGDTIETLQVENIWSSPEENKLVTLIKKLADPEKLVQRVSGYYQCSDIAILLDSNHLEHDVNHMRTLLETAWLPVQDACEFPRRAIIVDSLDSFVGLDAQVVIFITSDERKQRRMFSMRKEKRSLAELRYRSFIASRAISKLVFVVQTMDVKTARSLKFDPTRSAAEQLPVKEAMASVTTDEKTFGLGVTPLTGHVVLCHPWTDDPRHQVACVTPDGRYQASAALTPPTGWRPWTVSIHPHTQDLLMGCWYRQDGSRYCVALYRHVEAGVWAVPPPHTEIHGEWGNDRWTRVAWVRASEALVTLRDKGRVNWLVTLDTAHGVTERARVALTQCGERILDVDVSPEGDLLYLCDLSSDLVHVMSPRGEPRHRFSVYGPYSVCGVRGGRVLMLHLVTQGGERSYSVGLYDREGGHLRDIVTSLPAPGGKVLVIYMVRLCESRRQLYVCEAVTLKTVWRYDVGGRLEP